MARRKMLIVFFSIQPDSQPANALPPILEVFVNQLSQKQTLSIRSMYKLCLSKKFFLATPLSLLQTYLQASFAITNAFCLGQKSIKP